MSQVPAGNPPPAVNELPHAPPRDEETIYYQGKPRMGGMPGKTVGLVLAGTVLLLIPVLWRLFMHGWPNKWVVIALTVVALGLWCIPLIISQTIRYRITNYRVDYERGLIARDICTLELWHVHDLSFHQSLLDRMLGIGTIRVMSDDVSMPDLHMVGVPNARKLFEQLKQRVIAVKRQTGVLKVDTGN